jgi:hypothetical protein
MFKKYILIILYIVTLLFTATKPVLAMTSEPSQTISIDEDPSNPEPVKLNSETTKPFLSERRMTNLFDFALCSLTTKVFNDYLLENPHKLALLESMGIGTIAWLIGEITEMVFKKIYKISTKTNLRNALGNFYIFGNEIDCQRFLRRVVQTMVDYYIVCHLNNIQPLFSALPSFLQF